MTPLKNWDKLKKGYRFKEKTWYSEHHLGLDLIVPSNTPVYAPANGLSKKYIGRQGGNTVHFYWDNKILRVLHLSKFGKIGNVKKGEIIGYSGNSGSLSTGPHAHIDISKNKINIYDIDNFIDPETFNFNVTLMKIAIDTTHDQYLIDETSKFGASIADGEELFLVKKHFEKLGMALEKPVLMDLTGYFIFHGGTALRWKSFLNI